MRPLAPLDSVAFAELVDLCRIDAARSPSPFRPNGSFVCEARNGGKDRYWYYRGYERTADGSPGTATKSFFGRAGDERVETVVAAHAEARASYTTRRQIVARLRRAGLPAPHHTEGAIIQILAEAGILTSGATIVGSAAFQTYGALLGMRFEHGHYRTQDLDLAQPRGMKLHLVGVAANDMLEVLRRADATFAPVFHASEPQFVVGYRSAQQFRVEFLTPMAGRRSGGRFASIAGLPGVGAQQLKFLEFLLEDTRSAVTLYEAGVLVPVPDPARFAVHKLIVSVARGDSPEGSGKSLKDVLQAQNIIDGMALVREPARLGRTWLKAWTRGPSWRKTLREGTLRLSMKHLQTLAGAVSEAAAFDGTPSPFDNADDPRRALATG